jgi:hypothetical protein
MADLTVWRPVEEQYSGSAFSGEGARQHGGDSTVRKSYCPLALSQCCSRSHADDLTRAEDYQKRWKEIVADPNLHGLPYKVETNQRGQIVLSPHRFDHSYAQGDIIELLFDPTFDTPARGGADPFTGINNT